MGRKHHVALVLVLSILLLMIGARATAQVEIPRITIHELKGMIDRGESVIILDTQPKAIFEKVHIKGAVSLPWKARITLQDVSGLPRDKLIVTYCTRGSGDSTSANVAEQLMRLGFSDIKVLADPSIKGWKEAGYPLERAPCEAFRIIISGVNPVRSIDQLQR